MFFGPGRRKDIRRRGVGASSTARRQRGAVTLILAIVLLILTSMVAAYTGSTVLFEQKVSANEFRAGQAFEAAVRIVERPRVYGRAGRRRQRQGRRYRPDL